MSDLAIDSTGNEEKRHGQQQRPLVSSKSLLTIKTIVAQNVTNKDHNRKLAPLPLKSETSDSQMNSSVQEVEDLEIITVPKESHSNLQLCKTANKYEASSNVPPLPLNRSINSSDSFSQRKRRSFPVQSHNRMNPSIELPISRQQWIPIHRLDSASPTISTLTDDNEEETKLDDPLVFVNKSFACLTVSNSNERNDNKYQPNRRLTNYPRFPHSLRNPSPLMNTNHHHHHHHNHQSYTRRSFPRLESVHTPIQKSSVIPGEIFDCCQTETKPTARRSYNESYHYSTSSRDATQIRDIMFKVSKRLTQYLDSSMTIPIVDTHCHFDLVFDRLRIKHNNLTKYFTDYNEFYPAGLSFELAIQVFWRPEQLTESNWTDWFSKYLNNDRVYGSCGIHPHWSSAWKETSVDDIERCLQHPKIVAIGEIGLDFGPKNTCLIQDQRRAFEGQLKLAAKWSKPIVIHSRDAYKETFKLMKQYLKNDHKIHLHCFVGTYTDVQMFTSYFTSIKFGFTPIITKSNFLHRVIEQIPITQILSETDSPYFIPDELSMHTRCAHPGMVYSVVETVAQLRQLPVYDVACQLRENAREIYGI